MVPDKSFEHVEALMEDCSERSNFCPEYFAVDDAHQNRERTLAALNCHRGHRMSIRRHGLKAGTARAGASMRASMAHLAQAAGRVSCGVACG